MAARLPKRLWYAVKVQRGQEGKVCRAIRRQARIDGHERFVGRCLYPTIIETVLENGSRKKRRRRLWEEYILVEVHYNIDVFYLIRNAKGTILPDANAPINVSPEEIREVLFLMHCEKCDRREQEAEEKKGPQYQTGDAVVVIDGMFKGETGKVKSISKDAEPKVVIPMMVMGRQTDVILNWFQVEKQEESDDEG